jgi:hypothetical protein
MLGRSYKGHVGNLGADAQSKAGRQERSLTALERQARMIGMVQ